jgi:hypothetical protein
MSIDDGDALANVGHEFDELARLIQVVEKATAENNIEHTILRYVLDIVTGKGQIGEIGSRFNSLAVLEIAFPDLDAERIETHTRELDRIATFQASEVNQSFAGNAAGVQHLQESLTEPKQHQVIHLPSLFRLCERPIVKPDIVRCESTRHFLLPPVITAG